MVGKLYIDGKDAYTDYGICVEQSGYKALVALPEFKKIESVEWDEYDGEEADLTEPMLDSRTIAIPFNIINSVLAEFLFVNLSDKAYHTFEFTELGKEYRLRMESNGSFNLISRSGKMTLTFVEDDAITPVNNAPSFNDKSCGYIIDDVDLSRFGIAVLQGTDDTLRKFANIRPALLTKSSAINGQVYDNAAPVKVRAKDITISVGCRANIAEFWGIWESLLWALTRPEYRVFRVPKYGIEYNCYYNGSKVRRFEVIGGKTAWFELDITLRCSPIFRDSAYLQVSPEVVWIYPEAITPGIFIVNSNTDWEVS